jgi:hypothetical protein
MKTLLLFLLIFLPGLAFPQKGRQNTQNRNYDPSTKTVVKGTIEEFISRPARHSNATGWHMRLKSNDKTWFVHLGPKWFYDKHKVQLSKGMKVEVEGSVIKMGGDDVLVAKEIKAANGEIKIRDDSGKPYFSRSRNK